MSETYDAGYSAGYRNGFAEGRRTIRDADGTVVIQAGSPDMPYALPGARLYAAHKFGVTARRITRVERTDRSDWCYWTGDCFMYVQRNYGRTWFLTNEEAVARHKQLKQQWQNQRDAAMAMNGAVRDKKKV